MKRGGCPEGEVEHANVLLEGGADDIWGWGSPAGKERVKARVEWLVKSCGLKKGIRALECGCGTGIFTRQIAGYGSDITAVDISEDLLHEAQKHCSADNVKFVQANLETPDNLEDESYDAIYGISVLHHLDLDIALPKLLKKLKVGGRFAFSEPNISNPINKYVIFTNDQEKRRSLGVSPTEMAFSLDELREGFLKAGFKVESLEYKDFLHPSVPGMLIPLVKAGQWLAENTPLLQRWAGSLWINGCRV